MNIIPIVFCFDDNLLLPAGVCLSSLLENAHEDTFYDIFILHDDSASYPTSGFLERLHNKYERFSIHYRSVGNAFHDAFEIRGITIAAYYRLLIPELIPEYDKIMYHDVDVIFREDLSTIYLETNMENSYIAGVISPGFLKEKTVENRAKLGLDAKEYILSGNLIFNSSLLRKDGVVDLFKKEARNDYYHQDMDVINIVCKDKIGFLPPSFCGTIEIYHCAVNNIDQMVYDKVELREMVEKGIVHYNGPKPWKTWCPNFDIWWEYYRKSVYYDSQYYFDFYHSKLDELDQLSLWKRVKLLLRYFKTGALRK